jgi:exosortase/archaeosortase family protein
MRFSRDFRQFLIRTGVFLGFFILISLIIGQGIVASDLLYGFNFYIYGGLGKVLLFSIFGFILFYRLKISKVKVAKRGMQDSVSLLLSLLFLICFYLLELRVDLFIPTIQNILMFHLIFLLIFVFLAIGVFGLEFLQDFVEDFRKEIFYFVLFGIVVYSAMTYVWKLWPYLSLAVTWSVSRLLGIFGDAFLIGDNVVSFGGFTAEIGEACSGVYSIFLFTALYLFAVILDWGKLDKGKVFLLFLPAVAGAFLVNILRVFTLFLVGAYVSETLALGLYHSYVGMIFFLVYFSVFWFYSYGWMKKGSSE